jgi:hypothetical protein
MPHLRACCASPPANQRMTLSPPAPYDPRPPQGPILRTRPRHRCGAPCLYRPNPSIPAPPPHSLERGGSRLIPPNASGLLFPHCNSPPLLSMPCTFSSAAAPAGCAHTRSLRRRRLFGTRTMPLKPQRCDAPTPTPHECCLLRCLHFIPLPGTSTSFSGSQFYFPLPSSLFASPSLPAWRNSMYSARQRSGSGGTLPRPALPCALSVVPPPFKKIDKTGTHRPENRAQRSREAASLPEGQRGVRGRQHHCTHLPASQIHMLPPTAPEHHCCPCLCGRFLFLTVLFTGQTAQLA